MRTTAETGLGVDCSQPSRYVVKPLKTKNRDDVDELRTHSKADPDDGAAPGDLPELLRRQPRSPL
jgi:hypothetical protein